LSCVFGCSPLQNKPSYTSSEKLTSEIRPLEAVAALGQIQPAGDIRRLAAPVSGFGGTPRVAKLLVDEGDYVRKGQKLVVFDNRPQVLSELTVLKARLNTLKVSLLRQEREVARYKHTAIQGATSLVLLEEKEDELIRIKGEIDEINAEMYGLDADLENTELKSPIEGIVLVIHTRVGERATSIGVLEVGSNKIMNALIEVYESDINRVKISQEVTLISENGGFDGILSGYVSSISPQVRQRKVLSTDPTGDADARVVEVKVTLDSKSSSMVSNLTGMKIIARFQPI
tara:strand:- start:236 stop:1096 length:861 start_codon:yes stop_codon:yes gene_type:complete